MSSGASEICNREVRRPSANFGREGRVVRYKRRMAMEDRVRGLAGTEQSRAVGVARQPGLPRLGRHA